MSNFTKKQIREIKDIVIEILQENHLNPAFGPFPEKEEIAMPEMEKVMEIMEKDATPTLKRKKKIISENPQSKQELYFEQLNKIADLELRDRCKELYDDDYSNEIPNCIREAICGMFRWKRTKGGTTFWSAIANRTDLETNPYIISKWTPHFGDEYYTTNPTKHSKYNKWVWGNDAAGNIIHERGLVFRTSEEAISCTNKMLEAIKK